jgi:hypothetical protein
MSIKPTPRFQQWFGASKVVDDAGRPLVVYHGTHSKFSTFDLAKLGSSTGAKSAKGGFFFTSNKGLAESYGSQGGLQLKKAQVSLAAAREQIKELTGDNWAAAGSNLARGQYDSHVKIKRIERAFRRMQVAELMLETQSDPYTANHTLASSGTLHAVFMSLQNPLVHVQKSSSLRDERFSVLVERAKAEGRDGLIIRNTEDPALEGGDYDPEADIFVAFNPEQILSADGNVGQLDAWIQEEHELADDQGAPAP